MPLWWIALMAGEFDCLSGQGGENREISDVVISHSNTICLTLIGRNRQIINKWPWRQSRKLTYGHLSNVLMSVWVCGNIRKYYYIVSIPKSIRTEHVSLWKLQLKLSSNCRVNFPRQLGVRGDSFTYVKAEPQIRFLFLSNNCISKFQ